MNNRPPARRGRPRSQATRQTILRATNALLEAHGYTALTIEGVAEQAGVSKSTIYRWWASKAELAMEAYAASAAARLPLPDTGDLAADLLAFGEQFCQLLRTTSTPKIMSGLAAAAFDDQALAQAFRHGFISTRRTAMQHILERASERGEIAASTNIEQALDHFYGPIFYRLLFRGAPIDTLFVQQHVQAMLTLLERPAPSS